MSDMAEKYLGPLARSLTALTDDDLQRIRAAADVAAPSSIDLGVYLVALAEAETARRGGDPAVRFPVMAVDKWDDGRAARALRECVAFATTARSEAAREFSNNLLKIVAGAAVGRLLLRQQVADN
jgi:hypothetical protein